MHEMKKILETKEFIISKTNLLPTIGIILGSGLGNLTDEFKETISIPYADIPHFAKSNAIGHTNELVIGKLFNKTLIAMKGRFHYYEGYSLDDVTFPIRVMKELGVNYLIITNSCGAVNKRFRPGDLMLITDHLNLVGINPLIGKNDNRLGTRFPDLSNVYDKNIRNMVVNVAHEEETSLQEGVYAWWSGPSYETPAEIKMIRTLGADAVGMSTVPEAIVAVHAQMKVIGISCLTNMASGILDKSLTHEEVIEEAKKAKEKFTKLIIKIIKKL